MAIPLIILAMSSEETLQLFVGESPRAILFTCTQCNLGGSILARTSSQMQTSQYQEPVINLDGPANHHPES